MGAWRLSLAVILVGLGSAPLSGQVLSGRVVEEGSERPVAGASLTLFGGGQALVRTESDSLGRFRLPAPQPGSYTLRVERIGYATTGTSALELAAGEAVEIVVRLGVDAVPLETLLVVDRLGFASGTEFDRRRRMGEQSGLGRFLDREELEAAGPTPVTALLGRVPQVSVAYDAEGQGWPVLAGRGGTPGIADHCRPALFLNGARFQLTTGESIDRMLSTEDLEGVEIYRNAMEVPSELGGSGVCGAIVFWTRSADATSGGLWRWFAAGGAALGMLLVFVFK